MLENEVEKSLVATTEVLGGEAFKFVVPGRRGPNDRIVLLPIPEEHRDIVARYVKFIEVKRPGGKPRVKQQRFLERLQELGLCATYVDCLRDVARLFTEGK